MSQDFSRSQGCDNKIFPEGSEFPEDTEISRETGEPLARCWYLQAQQCGVRFPPSMSLWPLCHCHCSPKAISKEMHCSRDRCRVPCKARILLCSAAGTCQAQSWPRAGSRQQMGLSGEGLQHRPRSWGRISISGGTGLTGPGSEQGPADGRCPSQTQAFHQSHLHMVLSPALSSPSSFSLLSACTAVISCCWLSCPPPDIVPTRSASQDAPYALTTQFNPVSLVSYRNMFPSNLVEASFQQVSSPEPSACSQDGAQLHTGLPLCPPTAWTGASSLLFLAYSSSFGHILDRKSVV